MKKMFGMLALITLLVFVPACRKKVIAPPPNQPPTASCSAEKGSVYAGSNDAVNVSAQASDPEGKPLNYSWTASGGQVQGTGSTASWSSAGLAPGTYTVTARVDDGAGGTATCSVDVRVEPRPNRAPSLTCSAERPSAIAGERVRISGQGNDSDGDSLTYSWRSSGGTIVGSGSSVQLDTSGLAPGRYTVTGRVEDGRGGAADCSADISVEAPPPPPQASKLNEFLFRSGSARVDNVGKRVLDDVALRLKGEPDAKVALVGYADPKEPQRLAAERANQTKKYLVGQGIAENRIDTRAGTGQAGAGQRNRRVDVVLVPKGATY